MAFEKTNPTTCPDKRSGKKGASEGAKKLPALRLGANMKKQSQFAGRLNERKLNVDKGVYGGFTPAVPPKQSQFKANLLRVGSR